mmetsp:Transcript_54015/g.89980  ORF Transcript_54015/g.89980 Transcript_54015/m.89980 type:complete len:110 (-) Transcript_54015:7-336(-)
MCLTEFSFILSRSTLRLLPRFPAPALADLRPSLVPDRVRATARHANLWCALTACDEVEYIKWLKMLTGGLEMSTVSRMLWWLARCPLRSLYKWKNTAIAWNREFCCGFV